MDNKVFTLKATLEAKFNNEKRAREILEMHSKEENVHEEERSEE